MSGFSRRNVLCGLLACAVAGTAGATIPYTPVVPGTPVLGPGVLAPSLVPGKEYSHDRDYMITAAGTAPDPEQIVAWDGIGGVADGIDYSFTRPTFTPDLDIDAIANHADLLYEPLKRDDAHLLFSLDDTFTIITPGGPAPGFLPPGLSPPGVVVLGNGNMVGGSGEISIELGVFGGANPTDFQTVWAPQTAVNGMPLPHDVDGLEIWGPEPGFTGDSDKYSLDFDALTGGAGGPPAVSVWNGSGTPYIGLPTITAAVTSLLGPLPDDLGDQSVNLDALMVHDVVGSDEDFGRDPAGGGAVDEIIFSIRQIVDLADPDGYYATGSELFVLDAAGGVSFLAHGGHLWDHTYALSVFSFGTPGPDQNFGAFDINAIEAVTEGVIPEPAAAVLLGAGWVLCVGRRKRGA